MLNDFYILNIINLNNINFRKITFSGEGYWMRPQCGGYIPPARYIGKTENFDNYGFLSLPYSFSFTCNGSETASEIILMGGISVESIDK